MNTKIITQIFLLLDHQKSIKKRILHTLHYMQEIKKGVFYHNRNRSPPRTQRSRSPHYPRRSRSPRSNRFERKNYSSNRNYKVQKKNVMGPDGRHKECNFCSSVWHFINDCPDFHKHRKLYREEKSQEVQEVCLSFW